MSEHAKVVNGQVVEVVDLDPAWYQSLVTNGNPKAASYRPVFTDPVPPYNQATQAVDEKFTVASDRVTRGWTVRAKTPDELRKTWTSFEFLNRFTPTERAAIRTGAMSDPVLADFLMMSQAAQEVVSDDPVTGAGMDYLVSVGILTAARKAEILS
jgi:hypothetical protein